MKGISLFRCRKHQHCVLLLASATLIMPLMVDFPLTRDPGTEFQYSNLTSHWLGVIVSRACDTDLKSFAQEHLFSPLGAEVGGWLQYEDGYISILAAT